MSEYYPIVELKDANHHIKIYANGIVEGWSGDITQFINIAIKPELFSLFSKPAGWDFSPPHYGIPKEVVDTH